MYIYTRNPDDHRLWDGFQTTVNLLSFFRDSTKIEAEWLREHNAAWVNRCQSLSLQPMLDVLMRTAQLFRLKLMKAKWGNFLSQKDWLIMTYDLQVKSWSLRNPLRLLPMIPIMLRTDSAFTNLLSKAPCLPQWHSHVATWHLQFKPSRPGLMPTNVEDCLQESRGFWGRNHRNTTLWRWPPQETRAHMKELSEHLQVGNMTLGSIKWGVYPTWLSILTGEIGNQQL